MKIFHKSKNSLLLITIILNEIFSKENELITINKISEITVIINGGGRQNILREDSYIPLPNEMIVNDSPQNPIRHFVENLSQPENTIIMRWNYSVTDCSFMFADPTNVIKINLRNFDTSKVTNMNCMFCGLPYLTSLDLSGLNTSSTYDMSGMFYGCQLLRSLDLSTFDTSKVTDFSWMFHDCNSLQYINLNNITTSKAKEMGSMFVGCRSLLSIDLSSFDTSEVTDFSYMFFGCNSIKSLNLNNFISSKVTSMREMFVECGSLLSLDISSFDTSNVNDFSYMFYGCSSLKYLNLTNFVTSKGMTMLGMFQGCNSLLSLDISSFNTTNINDFSYMFENCISLTSLNLKNFDTSSCNQFSSMFEYCSSLISLDLSSFIIQQNSIKEHMFNKINQNLVLCFDETKVNLISELYESNKNNCSCYQNSYKFFYDKSECIDSCSKDVIYQFEYENICYQACPIGTHVSPTNKNKCEKDLECEHYYNYEYTGCIDEIPSGYYLNDTNSKTIDKCQIKCKECSLESIELDLCISCNESNNYFPNYNEINNTYYNCYNNEDSYYLDINNKVYKPCYSTCKKCIDYGNDNNHECTECIDDYISLGSNCFQSCNKKIIEKNLCIDDCSLDIEYKLEYNNICYKSCPNGTIAVSHNNSCIKYQKYESTDNTDITESTKSTESTEIIEFTESKESTEITEFTKSTVKTIEITEYTDKTTEITEYTEIIKTTDETTESKDIADDTIYNEQIKDSSDIFHDIENSQKNKDEAIKTIENYIINGLMDSLLSNVIEGAKKDIIIKSENIIYQITSSENQKNKKNNSNNESTIELGECEKTLRWIYNINDSKPLIMLKINYFKKDLLIPIIGYEVFHPVNKSKLNLNYCRNNINVSIPVDIDEDNLFKYDPNSEYYTDQCNPYTTDNGTDILINDRQNEFNDNKMSLCENTCELNEYEYDTKKVVCECKIKVKQIEISEVENQTDLLYHNFTSVDESSNIVIMKCFYILFTKEGLLNNIGNYILLFNIILFLTSSIVFYKCGYALIERMIEEEAETQKKRNTKKIKNSKGIINIFNAKTLKNKAKNKTKNNKEKLKKSTTKNIKPRKKNSKLTNSINKRDITYSRSISKLKSGCNGILLLDKKKAFKNKIKKKKKKSKFEKKPKLIFDDYELNIMIYQLALEYDKRTFSQYYNYLIKKKHPILFSFYFVKDYNSNIIKLNLFFLSFSIYYFVNALFFNESIIHKIYEEEGIYNIIYLMPFTLYSFVISHFLFLFVKYFSLSESNIYKIIANKANDNREKVKRQIITKYIVFYTLSIMFLLFLWYYLSSFGAVYQNTQVHLFYNTIMSFGFSLLYPFIFNLIPSFLRIYSLNNNEKGYAYKISYIIQYF